MTARDPKLWTKDIPVVEGWYWFSEKFAGLKKESAITLVWVGEHTDGDMIVMYLGLAEWEVLDITAFEDCEWKGPIEEPTEGPNGEKIRPTPASP